MRAAEPLIDRAEVRRQLAVGDSKVRELERRGLLPPVRLGHRCVRYRAEDLRRLREGATS